MKSDLVKAATILGVSTGVAIVAASVVIVFGVRWAINSALDPQVRSLDATVANAASRIEASVQSASTDVSAQIDQSAGKLDASVLGVSVQLASATEALSGELDASSNQLSDSFNAGVERLNETLLASSGHVGDRIDAGTIRVSETAAQAFREPLLIRAPQPLPITGTLAIEGRDAEDATPVEVDANILSGG